MPQSFNKNAVNSYVVGFDLLGYPFKNTGVLQRAVSDVHHRIHKILFELLSTRIHLDWVARKLDSDGVAERVDGWTFRKHGRRHQNLSEHADNFVAPGWIIPSAPDADEPVALKITVS